MFARQCPVPSKSSSESARLRECIGIRDFLKQLTCLPCQSLIVAVVGESLTESMKVSFATLVKNHVLSLGNASFTSRWNLTLGPNKGFWCSCNDITASAGAMAYFVVMH